MTTVLYISLDRDIRYYTTKFGAQNHIMWYLHVLMECILTCCEDRIGQNQDLVCLDYCDMFVRVDICQNSSLEYLGGKISLRIQVRNICEGKYMFRIQEEEKIGDERYLSKSWLTAVSAAHRTPAVAIGEGAERAVSY